MFLQLSTFFKSTSAEGKQNKFEGFCYSKCSSYNTFCFQFYSLSCYVTLSHAHKINLNKKTSHHSPTRDFFVKIKYKVSLTYFHFSFLFSSSFVIIISIIIVKSIIKLTYLRTQYCSGALRPR
jgi:hypothetical protein